MGNRVCVPKVDDLQKEVMEEAHYSPYSVHLGTIKMYRTLRIYSGGMEWRKM